jgi:uncharacterized repeat protein (TIGR04076 family)
MAELHPRYNVLVRVISQKGTCVNDHKVGDEWVIGSLSPGGICGGAYHIIHSRAEVLQYSGTFPWETDPDTVIVACPDPDNPVVFELRRVSK